MSERVYVFLFLQFAAVAMVGFPIFLYKSGFYGRREKRPARMFMYIVLPPVFLMLQVLAFIILLSSDMAE